VFLDLGNGRSYTLLWDDDFRDLSSIVSEHDADTRVYQKSIADFACFYNVAVPINFTYEEVCLGFNASTRQGQGGITVRSATMRTVEVHGNCYGIDLMRQVSEKLRIPDTMVLKGLKGPRGLILRDA
jgi:hypothetical protein